MLKQDSGETEFVCSIQPAGFKYKQNPLKEKDQHGREG